ncbi:MAG: alkaline phosphatase family protein [Thermoflexales bacterium]
MRRVTFSLLEWCRLAISLAWFSAIEASLVLGLMLSLFGEPSWTPRFAAQFGLVVALLVGLNFGLLPVMLWLRLPINPLTVNGAALLINGAVLRWAAGLLVEPERALSLPAFVPATLLLAIANTVLNGLIALDDEYTFFQFVIQSARDPNRSPLQADGAVRRGMVLLQVDGLSHPHLKQALELGLMPNLREMLGEGFQVTGFDCGLPSQTSAFQAAIFYGNNDNIPAFRWYERERARVFVSNRPEDARLLQARYHQAHGLLSGGSSINNLLSGGAARAVLTLSELHAPRALEDLTAFWLNPILFGRTLALCALDLLREIGWTLRQHLRGAHQPLLLPHALLRPVVNVLLRDMTFFIVMREIQRGSPIIYATFIGYDVAAHRAGPDCPHALNTLRGFDRHLRHIRQAIRHLAPFEYDLFVLSDHGQTGGLTFRQRYGLTLHEWIARHIRRSARVSQAPAVGESGRSLVAALVSDLRAASDALHGQKRRRLRRATMRAAAHALEGLTSAPPPPPNGIGDVVVCASGCLAHVYFPSIGSPATWQTIEAHYPGLLDALTQHEGIGFVIARDGEDLIVLGRHGARSLINDRVIGKDPLEPFGAVALRAAQLRRLAEFLDSGDLIINSAPYPDGSVAAFEELLGSHGGLGGPQTEAFIVHPALPTLEEATVRDAAHLFAVLEDWRRRCAIHASCDT